MGSVDPGKDITAFTKAIDAKLKTYEEATTELGYGDFEANAQTLKEELKTVAELNKIGEVQDDNN